jgi:hypothetical protein
MTMDQFVKYLALLPTILALINTVEGLFGHLPGAVKLGIVVNMIKAAAAANGTALLPVHETVLTTTIDTAVAGLNHLNVFQHSTAKPPA